VGKKPVFTDSEVITLMLAQDYIPFPNEIQYVKFIRANYLYLFPKLVDQSQFNRRARSLQLLVEQLRRDWIVQKGWNSQAQYLRDTKCYKGHIDFLITPRSAAFSVVLKKT
jgi:hypothetical protein